MINLKSIQEELGKKISRARLEEILEWAFKNDQTDVSYRVAKLLFEYANARYFNLGLARPFLSTLRTGSESAFDVFNPTDLPEGLAKPSTMDLSELYETINNKILKAVSSPNQIPWNKPWVKPSKIDGDEEYTMYLSYATNKPYSIINQLMIDEQLGKRTVSNPFFITSKTVKRLKGKLKPSARPVVLYVAGVMWIYEDENNKFITYNEQTMKSWLIDNKGFQGAVLETMVKECFRRFLTTTDVYSAEDVKGIKFNFTEREYIPGRVNQWKDNIEAAEAIVDNRPAPQVSIIHKSQDSAYYQRLDDEVVMPLKDQFPKPERYYSTLFHEIVHSTGSKVPKRLSRTKGIKQFDPNYNREELVAEIGASYLTAEAGILNGHIEHTADYLKSFIDGLKKQIGEDPETLITAFANAQRAAEFVLQRNTNGTPKYVAQILEARKKELEKLKEKEAADKKKKSQEKPKKSTSKKTPVRAVKKKTKKPVNKLVTKPLSRKQNKKPTKSRGSIFAEIEAIKSKPTGKLKAQQLNLFDRLLEPGLAAPEDWISNQLKYQESVIRIKYGLPVKETNITVGDIPSNWENISKSNYIKIPKKYLAELIKEVPDGPTFYNLIDILNSITLAKDFVKTGKTQIWLGLDLIDFAGGKYKAVLKLSERKDGLYIDEFLKRVALSTYKDLKELAELKATRYKKLQKSKASTLANPVDHSKNDDDTIDNIVEIVKEVYPDNEIVVYDPKKDGTKAELTNSKLPKDLAKLFDHGGTEVDVETFRLPGEIGKLLGELQAFKLAIQLTGDPHAGKTEFLTQIADAIVEHGDSLAYLDLEQGGLQSKDTQAAFDRNIAPDRQRKIQVMGEAPEGINTVQKVAPHFDWVIIDSFQELDAHVKEFNQLRKEFPSTRFIFIFQQNADGKARGGVKTDYDANVRLKVFKVDNTFVNNYVEVLKNRGNTIGLRYNVSQKKMIENTDMTDFEEIDNGTKQFFQNSNWSNEPLLLN